MLNLTNYQQTDQIYLGTRTLVYKAIREREGKPVIVKVLRNRSTKLTQTYPCGNCMSFGSSVPVSQKTTDRSL